MSNRSSYLPCAASSRRCISSIVWLNSYKGSFCGGSKGSQAGMAPVEGGGAGLPATLLALCVSNPPQRDLPAEAEATTLAERLL